ncbi:MAG: arginase family protein [Candidatus Omnitrophica bacterium]|nr:arginase family protein [Candidatus Omnitrophota bacterium]
MLSSVVRILNLDNSLSGQKKLLAEYHPQVIDLLDLGKQARLWLNPNTAHRFRKSLNPDLKNSITFLGSGDFHHLSSFLIEQFEEPLSVVIFDLHPDWDTGIPKFGCGSWVSRILEKKNVLKVILLGVSSGDISSFSIQTGNLKSLKNNRLEIFPYAHQPSRVFFQRVAENISLAQNKGLFFTDLYWQELKETNLKEFITQLIARLPSKQVYVSIDKDCLTCTHALTNWEEGHFALHELLTILQLVKEKLQIVGLDIVGDYSGGVFSNVMKNFFSQLDHPKNFTAKDKTQLQIDAVNERTNLELLKTLANGYSR